MPIDLYNLFGSPPCALVRMLAKHIGVDVNLKNLNLAEKEHLNPEFLQINPFHKVPTLVDEGLVVYESNAICYYLINKFSPECELYPKCLRGRTKIDQVLATVSSTVQPHYMAYFRPRFFTLTKPTPEEQTAFEENALKGLEHLIGDGKFAVGDKLTLADLSLISYLILVLEPPVTEVEKFPKLLSYYQRVKAELPYFDEINAPGIAAITKIWSILK